VVPSTKAASDALVDQIIRDLEGQPLTPGEKLSLVGHSAGGIIVNNVANAMRARGIPVGNLIMIGTPLFPGSLNAAMPSDVPITNVDDFAVLGDEIVTVGSRLRALDASTGQERRSARLRKPSDAEGPATLAISASAVVFGWYVWHEDVHLVSADPRSLHVRWQRRFK